MITVRILKCLITEDKLERGWSEIITAKVKPGIDSIKSKTTK